MSLRLLKELLVYHAKYSEKIGKHDYLNVFQKILRDLTSIGFKGFEGMRVLDLGCGQRFPFALLSASDGADVTALDINYVRPDNLPAFFFHVWQHNGLDRAIKSMVRRILFDKHYYSVLEESKGVSLREYRSKITFVTAETTASDYPLPSASFDLIVSNAVLEHVDDVAGFASEVARLLVEGGYFYGWIHNFYSLSGGHNLQWAYPDEQPSKEVPPWDHLRDNLFPAHVFLNQYRPEEYLDIFSDLFEVRLFEGRDINHDAGGTEGEQFFLTDIEEELAEYPKDLLLTRSWCLICRKRA